MAALNNAKDNFREGYILLKRPFDFLDLPHQLPSLTVLYAYIESKVMVKELTDQGKDRLEEIVSGKSFFGAHQFKQGLYESDQDYEVRIEKEVKSLDGDPKNHKNVHKGNIVQSTVSGKPINFYPDEYSVISQETYELLLNEDDYLMVCENENAFKIKSVADTIFYLQSRGISLHRARKMASFGLKDMVYYLPHPELQKIFTRSEHVMYLPQFEEYYNNIYGGFEQFKESC